MSKFIDLIYNKYIKRYENIFIILIVLIIFIIAGYYGYKQFYAKSADAKIKKFKDVSNANTREPNAELFFFYVDWCPHCKTAKPIWIEFKEKYNNQVINNYTIKCNDVDCSDDNVATTAETIKRFKIEGYPTVKMMIKDKQYEFDAKISLSSLKKFVEDTTAAE